MNKKKEILNKQELKKSNQTLTKLKQLNNDDIFKQALQAKEKYYCDKYLIVFYKDVGDDEKYVAGFNTIRDICKYKKIPVTTMNIHKIQSQLTTALMKNPPTTKILGPKLNVYLIDMIDEN
jgi:hypothetical protein